MLIAATAQFPTFVTLSMFSLGIAQQVASVLLFVALFVHLSLGRVRAVTLVGASVFLSVGVACAGRAAHAGRRSSLVQSLPSLVILAFTLHALSPVVRTLSEATTNDSVWACATILFILHLAFADYAMRASSRPLLTSTVSLNLAMCASVVLSSRLAHDVDVFALLLVALQQFAIFPLLRERVYVAWGNIALEHRAAVAESQHVPMAALPLTVVLVTASVYAMLPLSGLVALVLVPGSVIFVCVLCPLWMRRAQRWKREMRGPWDEAVLHAKPADALLENE